MLRGSGGSLQPKIFIPEEGESRYELYNLKDDPEETLNLYFEHPEIVEDLTSKISRIVENGRSTPDTPQIYISGEWKQLPWMDLN